MILPETLTELQKKLPVDEVYKIIFSNTLIGVFIVQDFRFIYTNKAFSEVFEYREAELEGLDINAIVHPSFQEEILSLINQRILNQEVPDTLEVPGITKTGKIRYLKIAAKLIQYNGKDAIIGSLVNITDYKNTVEDLRNIELHYETLLDEMPEIAVIHDQGTITFLNKATSLLTGYRKEDLTGESLFSIIDPVFHNVVKSNLLIQSSNAVALPEFETDIRINDGTVRNMLVKSKSVNFSGKPQIVSFFTDLTEHKKNLAQIVESENRFRQTVERTFDGFVLFNKGRILEANHAAALIAGQSSATELIGRSIPELVGQDQKEQVGKFISGLTENQMNDHFEFWFTNKGEKKIFLELYLNHLRDAADGTPVIQAVFRDITARRLAEDKISIHEKIFRAISLASERLLSSTNPDEAVNYSLGMIGRLVQWDRVYIVRNIYQPGNTGLFMKCIYRWVNDGIAVPEWLSGMNNLAYLPGFSQFYHTLMEGRSVSGTSRDFSGEMHKILEPNGVKYVLILPIFVHRYFWGFIGYDDCSSERSRTEDEILALNTLCNILGNYFIRMATEVNLTDSKRFNSEVVNSMSEGLVVYDTDFRYIVWNKYMENLTGYRASEVLGRLCFEVFPAMEKRGLEEKFKQVLTGKTILPAETEFNFERMGRSGWVSAGYCPHYNSAGEITGILGLIRDVTEQVSAVQKIRNSEQYFHRLIENSADVICITDKDGVITFASPSSFNILGYEPGEMIGKKAVHFTHPDESESLTEIFRDLFHHRDVRHSPIEVGFRFRNKSDEWLDMEGSVQNLTDDEYINGVVFTFRDIGTRKKAEEGLRQSNELVRSFFELSAAGFALVNPEGKWILFNDKLCEMLGYSRQELMQKKWMDITPDDILEWEMPRYRDFQNNITGTLEFEKEFTHKNGSRFAVNISTYSVRDSDGKLEYLTAIIQDISEKKAAQQRLEESESKYRTIINNTHDAIYIYRGDHLIFVNEIGVRLLEYDEQEIYSRNIEDFIHPDDLEFVNSESINRFSDQNSLSNYVARIITGTGKIKTAEFTVQAINYQGEPAALGSARDITDLVAKQEELRKVEQLFKLITENSNDVIWTTDMNFRLTYESPANRRLTGYDADESIGLSINQIFTPESLSIAASAFEEEMKLLALEKTVHPHSKKLELEEVCKDGSILPVEINMSLIFDSDGKPSGILGITRDISERRKAEKQREIEEERIRVLYSLSQMSHEDEDSLIRYTINEAVKLTNSQIGYINFIVDEMVRMNMFVWSEKVAGNCNISSPEKYPIGEAGLWAECLKSGKPAIHNEFESDPRRKEMPEGHCPVFRHMSVPVKDTGGKIVMIAGVGNKDSDYDEFDAMHLTIIVSDLWKILKRKRTEDELIKLNSELEKRVHDRTIELEAMNQELEAFSFSISHDLRAPLRSIVGFSQALQEEYSEVLSGEGSRYLERLIAGTKKLSELIDDLLNLSRVTRSLIKRTKINLTEMAIQICEKLALQYDGHCTKYDVQQDIYADADPNLIQIALENLLDNAWKYSSKKEKPEIYFGCRNENNSIVYFVKDNGAGFDMAFAGKLFNPFQRLHLPSEFEGTGIGLATVKRIINKHGGQISAYSEPDRGARFEFTLTD